MLAEGDEPLILADGTKINPSTGEVIKDKKQSRFVEVPSPSAAQALVVRSRKSIADLPVPPKQLTGVALVAFYTLFGLSDSDISVALDGVLTVEQIKNIRKLEPYTAFMENAKTNIIETSTDQVRELFQKQAINAASKIIELADGENDVLSFKASQDILDRAGHRPADVVEHRHRMEDSLNIVITRRDATESIPTVDITPDRVTYNDE
jgi:hypothetical protein